MSAQNDTAKLRSIFSDIIRGATAAKFQDRKIYIKHFGLVDQVDIDECYALNYDKAKKRGIPTLEQTVEDIKRRGWWTIKDDVEIAQKKSYIDQLEKTVSQLSLIAEIEAMKIDIQKEKKEYYAKINEKDKLISLTCEKYTNQIVNNYFIFLSMYKDKDLNKTLFDEDQFDNLEEKDMLELIMCFNTYTMPINTENIKKISVSTMFQNSFHLANSVYEYWGKRIVDLTSHQSELASYGLYFKNILKNNDIPDDIRGDPEKMVEFVNMNHKIKKETEIKGKTFSLVGATKADYDRRGLKIDNAIAKEARRLGRSLSAIEMARIEGVDYTG